MKVVSKLCTCLASKCPVISTDDLCIHCVSISWRKWNGDSLSSGFHTQCGPRPSFSVSPGQSGVLDWMVLNIGHRSFTSSPASGEIQRKNESRLTHFIKVPRHQAQLVVSRLVLRPVRTISCDAGQVLHPSVYGWIKSTVAFDKARRRFNWRLISIYEMVERLKAHLRDVFPPLPSV